MNSKFTVWEVHNLISTFKLVTIRIELIRKSSSETKKKRKPHVTEAPCNSRCGTIELTVLIDWLYVDLCPVLLEYFTRIGTSPIPMKCCKICLLSALRAFQQEQIFIWPYIYDIRRTASFTESLFSNTDTHGIPTWEKSCKQKDTDIIYTNLSLVNRMLIG